MLKMAVMFGLLSVGVAIAPSGPAAAMPGSGGGQVVAQTAMQLALNPQPEPPGKRKFKIKKKKKPGPIGPGPKKSGGIAVG